jgi:acyl-CoA synthetase (NDP forming)
MDKQKLRQFESIFYPKSIAVVGASGDERETGTIYLRNLLKVSG